MRLTFAFFLLPAIAAAQQPAPQASPADTGATFTSTTQLVVETVTVRDSKGNVVEGLEPNDFTVTEDGTAQKIAFFEFQKLPDGPPSALPEHSKPIIPVPKLTSTQISPEPAGTTKYKDKRLLVLYFDMSALPIPDQLRTLDAAKKFIRTQMTASDLVALMKYDGGSVNVLRDFTDDRDQLLSVIETMIVGEAQGLDETLADAAASDTGAAFGQDDSEFNIFNTDRQLAALQTAVKMLGSLNEKKSLLYFSSGIHLNGIDNQAQLHATVNAAIRSGVSLWPVDSRGLVASAPMGDATQGSAGGKNMYSGAGAAAFASRLEQTQDTLYALASDTGGKALLDNNDLAAGIVNAQKATSSYYVIGYYTTNLATDGKFRRVKISLSNPSVKLDYRQGYYANKTFARFTAADKERQLEDALMLADPITELTITLEIDYFQLNRAEYFVPLVVKIPGRELALARRRGAEHTLIDFIGEIKDDFGTTITNVRDKVDIRLSDSTAAELAKKPIQYDTGFTLLPGNYSLKFLARDAETGRIGTFMTKFVIPNLNKEEKRVPISSVVLSSQRVDMREALFSAKDKEHAQGVNPLIAEGQKLIPSVTRVFRKDRDMYVYLQAYERGATATQPLVAFVTFYRGSAKAFETPPLPVIDGLDAHSKAVPLRFSISLGKLQPGEYNCQVTVVDPTSRKAAFWQAPIMLIQ